MWLLKDKKAWRVCPIYSTNFGTGCIPWNPLKGAPLNEFDDDDGEEAGRAFLATAPVKDFSFWSVLEIIMFMFWPWFSPSIPRPCDTGSLTGSLTASWTGQLDSTLSFSSFASSSGVLTSVHPPYNTRLEIAASSSGIFFGLRDSHVPSTMISWMSACLLSGFEWPFIGSRAWASIYLRMNLFR